MRLAKFKEDVLAINETIYFDTDQYLREKSSDLTRMKELIDDGERLLTIPEISVANQYFLYGALGNLYRIYGNPKLAIHYLSLNLQVIGLEDKVREVVTLIRLGEALKYNDNHANALAKFDRAIALCNEFSLSYLDFALQHKGKCLLEMNQAGEAITCFQKAYRIRKEKGDADLLRSTQLALTFARN